MATANDYNRIMRKAWEGVPNEQMVNVWPNHAQSYVRAMWKKATGRKLRYWTIRIGSGNRRTWVNRKVLTVNPDQGWHDLNHDFTHLIVRRTSGEAHSDRHLELERQGAELIKKRFLTEGKPPEKVKPTTRELQKKRAASVERRITLWEAKLRRSQNALVKLRKQKRYYDTALSQ